jgi:perosamine synthetase
MRFPVDKFINLFSPYIPEEATLEVINTLNSGWIGQGPKVEQFEKDFSEKFNQPYCVSMNSGTSALETAYNLAGITPGDEVICTPLTASCTNMPLLHMRAKIVWADINRKTLCLDREDVLRKITPRTKAIVNVHLGGVENNIGEMPVPVISDAAQALGVFTGDYTICSFQAIKHVTTGDGGMLVVNNEKQYKRAKLLRWFGIDRDKKKEDYKIREMTSEPELLGYKRQMNDIAAGMGIAGLKHYDEVIAHRKKIFELYKELLKVPVVDGYKNTYWLCTVLLENRDEVAQKLMANGVETNIVHVRNDALKIFGERAKLPNMDWVESRYLCLPLNMNTTEEDVIRISNLINQWTQ